MNQQSLAIVYYAFLLLSVGNALSAPKDTRPWTANRKIGLALAIPMFVSALWLAADAL